MYSLMSTSVFFSTLFMNKSTTITQRQLYLYMQTRTLDKSLSNYLPIFLEEGPVLAAYKNSVSSVRKSYNFL